MSINIPGDSAVVEFEMILSQYTESDYVISTCNATMSILSTFYALGLSGSEIITTPLTWPGSLSGLIMLGCKFRFCDVEPDTLTIDPNKLGGVISSKTRAVFSSDFLGYPAKLDEIKAICEEHNVLLIHDSASSFGSIYKGHYSGYFADVTILSFGAKKLFSLGEGGAIITRNMDLYNQLASMCIHPEKQDYILGGDVNPFALNLKINPLAAELGVKSFFDALSSIRDRRQNLANKLNLIFGEDILLLKANYLPNFYNIVLTPRLLAKNKNTTVKFYPLPFSKLIYQEDNFKSLNEANRCKVAEKMVKGGAKIVCFRQA